jgi:hypothetical protein
VSAVPCVSQPDLASRSAVCHALPRQAFPYRARPRPVSQTLPYPTVPHTPCHAMSAVPIHAPPDVAQPRRTLPRLPCSALSRPAHPCHASPCQVCHAMPFLVSPDHALPSATPPCRVCRAVPRRTPRCRRRRASPNAGCDAPPRLIKPCLVRRFKMTVDQRVTTKTPVQWNLEVLALQRLS